MKIRKVSGVLSEMLANMDDLSLAKTRNRMMIAAKIADAMRNEGINQKQFARKISRSESEISEWLSGDRNFTIDTITEIEQALKISLLNTNCLRYFYSEKVKKSATIVDMNFLQTTEYVNTSVSMNSFSKYKKNGTC